MQKWLTEMSLCLTPGLRTNYTANAALSTSLRPHDVPKRKVWLSCFPEDEEPEAQRSRASCLMDSDPAILHCCPLPSP